MSSSPTLMRRAAALGIASILAAAPLAACAAFENALSGARDVSTDGAYVADALGSPEAYAGGTEYYYDPSAYEDFNTEEYAAVDEGGFVLARTRPLSTVSSDVDTASWCNLRRMVREGYRVADPEEVDRNDDDAPSYEGYDYTIPDGAVRIEEMLNYFTYDYATPKGGERFSVTKRVGACPWNDETDLLVLGFATAEEDVASESGSNLVFLIDVSGSMDEEDKLPLLQDSFSELVKQLGGDDRVSIVTYAGEERLVLDGVPGDESRTILSAIRQLRADGSTNGERGLELAYEVAERNYREGGVNRIIMASDGDLNVGMTSESDLHDYVAKKRETGIYLSVLGFGSGNYKDTKMETLADDGNGSYHYIDCEEEAERVFGERLRANLVPFSDDVKVQVEFNPEQVKAYRLIGYENRAMADEDFRDDTADAGDVGPNAQFTVAYEIVRADSAFEVGEGDLKYQDQVTSGSDEWLTATLRYRSLDDDEVHEQACVVDGSDWDEEPGEDWTFQAAIIELGMLMRGSEHRGTTSLASIDELLDGLDATDERAGFAEVVDALRHAM